MPQYTNEVTLVANQGWDERILVCRNGRLVDNYIVVTQRFVALIDTLINAATAAQMVAYAKPFLCDGRHLLVVNTHADFDHCWGNQLFAGPDAPHPAPIIASQGCGAHMASTAAVDYLHKLQGQQPALFDEVVLTPPTVLFEDGLTLAGGDLTLTLLPTPGHTSDHISLYIPEIATLLAADAAELPYPAVHDAMDLPIMRHSLARLAALDAKHALYCHAPETIGPQLVRDNITYFDRIEAHCRAALAKGMPSQPLADADLSGLIDLPFSQAVPQDEHWQNIHEYYRTQGHAEQIRLMLAWLADATQQLQK